jgi:hypothetical protein
MPLLKQLLIRMKLKKQSLKPKLFNIILTVTPDDDNSYTIEVLTGDKIDKHEENVD